jgi:hypothetical protein
MDFKKYKNTMAYPNHNDFEKHYGYYKGTVVFSGNLQERNNFKDFSELGQCAVYEKVRDDVGYMKAHAEYNDEVERLTELFKKDLFEEYFVTDNPKAEACYSLAYQNGHAHGLKEIELHFDALVELIR